MLLISNSHMLALNIPLLLCGARLLKHNFAHRVWAAYFVGGEVDNVQICIGSWTGIAMQPLFSIIGCLPTTPTWKAI